MLLDDRQKDLPSEIKLGKEFGLAGRITALPNFVHREEYLVRRERLVVAVVLGAAIVLAASLGALAYGSHDMLNCSGCHSIHYAKAYKAFAVVNEKAANPRGNGAIDGVSALCLGCHENPENGGAGLKPIALHTTHPVNLAPNGKIAKVPATALVGGKLQCTSCHDPHPSNPSYQYLRVDTKGGGELPLFCAMCHPAKVDPSGLKGGLQAFTSMDESKGAVFGPVDELTYSNPTKDYYAK